VALALGGLLLFECLVQLWDGTRGANLTRAWTIQHGDTGTSSKLSGSRPEPHPDQTSSGSVRMPLSVTLDHQAFLPLVRGTGVMTEARALWVTRWDYSTITDVQTLVENAAGAGFNMLLFQVRGNADAFYAPGLEPWGARLSGGTLGEDPGWDPLQTAIEAAHERDLELHAYLNVYPVWAGQEAPPVATAPQHLFWTLSYRYTWDDWRVVDSDGVTMPLNQSYLWATPALTDVVDRVVSVTTDLVSRYDVDGIHLDYVRYPSRDTSYDPFSNARYQAAQGQEPDLTRAEWQRRQVTQLINRVYSETILPWSGPDLLGRSSASSRQARTPSLRLSAAVWPIYQDHWGWGYTAGYSDFYQDSQGWVQSGTIDAIMPMLYAGASTSHPGPLTSNRFALVASDFLAHDGGRHVFPGISAEHIDFAGISERIAIARDLGAPGHAIFSARLLAQKGYWDDLSTGPYATEAVVPPVTWRGADAAEH
jgi:uncharacterized lipoprotein YddW (UPF0748 family)